MSLDVCVDKGLMVFKGVIEYLQLADSLVTTLSSMIPGFASSLFVPSRVKQAEA